MAPFHRLGTLFILVALVAGLIPGMGSTSVVLAQSDQSVEAAVQDAVAELTGVDPASVMIEIVHESGDWSFGTATDAAINVRIFLAHRTDSGFEIAFRYDSEFAGLLARAPAEFPSPEIRASLEGIQLAGDTSADLSLPWPVGEWRRLTDVFENPYLSIDPVTYGPPVYAHNLPILAMRSGRIYFPCTGVAMIDHGDGFTTFYNHLASSPFSAGQAVVRGAQIGVTTNAPTCRSTGSGSRVEVWLSRYGQIQNLHGLEIGGYTINTSVGGINGPFTCFNGPGHQYCTLFGSSAGIPNLGVHGATDWPEAKITLQSSPPGLYLLSGFPPNTLVTMSWQRPDGSRLSMGTVTTNAGGSSYGIYTAPPASGGDYTRQNALVAQTGSIVRMIAVTPQSPATVITGMSYSFDFGEYMATAGQVVTISYPTGVPNATYRLQLRDSLNSTYPVTNAVTADAAGRWTYTFTIPTMAAGRSFVEYINTSTNQLLSGPPFQVIYQPLLLLSSNQGSGGPITVTLTHFAPNTEVRLGFGSGTCLSSAVTTVTTNSQGSATASITMPPGYDYRTIIASYGLTTVRTARYFYDTQVSTSVSGAAPGTVLNVIGTGINPAFTYQISWFDGVQWVDLASNTGNATTCSFSIPITVPATAAPGSTLFLRIIRVGSGYLPSVQVQVLGAPAQALVANAGSDQTLTTASATTSVTLNGSGSAPQALITGYSWRLAGTELATTANPTITLPVGVHELELTVRDSANRVAFDSMLVTVTSTNPPSAQFTPNQAAVGATVSYSVAGFPANTEIRLLPPSMSGSPTALATFTTNGAGTATGQLTIPSLPGGAPLEFSFSTSAAVATATLTIDPLFAMFSTNPLIANQTGRIRASGFAGNAPMIFEFQSGSNWVAIPLASPNTTGTGISTSNFTVPNTIPTGMTTFRLTTGSVTQTTTHQVFASVPPTASIASMATIVTANSPSGFQVNLNGSGSSDTDGTIVSWVWYGDDVQVATGATAQVWFPVGTHTIKLVVTDNSGATGQATRTLTVNNPAPTANIATIASSISANDPQGAQVALNGTASSDANGPLTYRWTDNDAEISTAATFTGWFQVGTHAIKLVVTDSHGVTAQATRTFTVTNPLPVANAGPDQTIVVNGSPTSVSVTLDGRQSSDANGPIASYVWTIGGNQIATGANPTVSIPNAPATITLTVTDAHGATRTDTVVISISGNTPPNVSAQVTGGNIKFTSAAQLQVTLDGSPTSDAQDADSAMTFVWTRNGSELGRGVTLPVTLQKGTHTILLTVTDTAAGVGSTTIQVIIADPPIANAGPDQSVTTTGSGANVNLTGSLSANPGGGTLTYNWYSNGSLLVSGATPQINLAVGTHTLELRVLHQLSGQTFTDTVVITVSVSTPQPTGVTIAPIRTTVNNLVTFNVTGFPANSPVTITWYRLTGSTLVVTPLVPAVTNASGAVTGQFRVPAVTGGPNQAIVFSSGSVARTVYFEVAPRIKSNTTPGLRGQTIDFSLRGFAKQETITVRWKMPSGRWVTVGTGTTSNTGSANLAIRVPTWATDGDNSVRAETRSFNQQTNVVFIQGGAPLTLAEALTPTPQPSATPEPTGPVEMTPTPDAPVDSPVETPGTEEPTVTPEPTPSETPAPETPTPEPDVVEPEPTPIPEPSPTPTAEQTG